ncbi:MAG TPA: T9SS type A sorting domain-containing protein, partial [Bacteroidales bacterium]|nr:T9SS type A sorting domain-containing protein [Bacteroidales bacterium]
DGVLCINNGKIVSEDEFSSIDPETYESIEVLKDQSAIALYGDKAKNGVIIIKLKDQKVANTEYRLLFAPNPASDDVTVTLEGSSASNKLDVKMYDKFGKVVFNDKERGPVFKVSVGSLPADVYIMIVTDKDKVYKGNLSVVH